MISLYFATQLVIPCARRHVMVCMYVQLRRPCPNLGPYVMTVTSGPVYLAATSFTILELSDKHDSVCRSCAAWRASC